MKKITDINLPEGEGAPKAGLEEMDVEAFFNLRDWVQEAIEAKGGKITDSGMGMGAADLGFELEGMKYGLSVWPR